MNTIPWVKLWIGDVLDGAVVAALPNGEWRLWVELECLAKQSDTPGIIEMSCQQIAWRVRHLSKAKVESTLAKFEKLGLVELVRAEDGMDFGPIEKIEMVDFTKRQNKHPSDLPAATRQRKQAQREREQMEQEEDDSHENVTTMSRAMSRRGRIEGDKEEDKEGEEDVDIEREKKKNVLAFASTGLSTESPSSLSTTQVSAQYQSMALPLDFDFTQEMADEMEEWLQGQPYFDEVDIDLQLETDKFKDHVLSKGITSRDWNAEWRKWIRRAYEHHVNHW